jgi:hypothetical protein
VKPQNAFVFSRLEGQLTVSGRKSKEMNMYYRVPMNLGQPAVSPPPFPPPDLTVFPNIDATMPTLSKAAADSVRAVQKLAWFNDTYLNLAQATANSALALDEADRVIVVPTEMNSVERLAPKLVKAFVKKAGLSLAGELVGKNLAKVLGLMPILLDLLVALTANERKNLVSEQNRSRRDEAFRFKLRFFIRLWLTEFSIGGPGADPNKQAWALESLFFQYRKVLEEWWKYLDIEKNLQQGMKPYQPRPATIGPA